MPAPRARRTATIGRLRDGILAWIATLADPDAPEAGRYRYNVHMVRPYGVESTLNVVLTLWLIDGLEEHPERDRILDFLLSCQDPEDGLFKDPLLDDSLRAQANHSWEHIWEHHTISCRQALTCAGVQPRHPLPTKSHVDLTEVDPAEWTRSLDWTRPYYVSEHFASVIMACRHKLGLPKGSDAADPIRVAFETLESEILEPESGLPNRRNRDEGLTRSCSGLGGCFKLMFAYEPCGRRYPRAAEATESILAMQQPNGEFGRGGMCMNWDAVWTLRLLTRDLREAARPDAVRAAARRISDYLLAHHLKPDGAFSFTPDRCLTVHNSIRVSDPWPESDTVGTPMALEVVRMNDAWQEGVPSQSVHDAFLGVSM